MIYVIYSGFRSNVHKMPYETEKEISGYLDNFNEKYTIEHKDGHTFFIVQN